MSAAWRSRFGVSICAFAPFDRLPLSISCRFNLRPPFGFTGVGSIPAWRLAWPCNWLSTSPRPPRSASDRRGVASSAGGELVGVEADKPGSLALVVGAEVSSTHHAWFAGVAERRQRIEQPVRAASSEMSAVLKSEPARAAVSDQPDGFEVEPRPLAVDPAPLRVGDRDVLAGRAADDDVGQVSEVGNKSSCREIAHVLVEADMGIVLRVEDAPPFDDLAGGDGDEAGAVQPERPAARRRAEQVERAHHRS